MLCCVVLCIPLKVITKSQSHQIPYPNERRNKWFCYFFLIFWKFQSNENVCDGYSMKIIARHSIVAHQLFHTNESKKEPQQREINTTFVTLLLLLQLIIVVSQNRIFQWLASVLWVCLIDSHNVNPKYTHRFSYNYFVCCCFCISFFCWHTDQRPWNRTNSQRSISNRFVLMKKLEFNSMEVNKTFGIEMITPGWLIISIYVFFNLFARLPTVEGAVLWSLKKTLSFWILNALGID